MAKHDLRKQTRSKYRTYPRIISNLKKVFSSFKSLKKASDWDLLKKVNSVSPEFFTPVNCMLIANEISWARDGRQAIFLGKADIKSLLKGKYSVSQLPSKFTPYNAFMMCLPAEFEHEGLKPSGVLVACQDESGFSEGSLSLLGHRAGIQSITDEDDDFDPSYCRGLTISYCVNNETARTQLSMYDDNLDRILSADTYKQYIKEQNAINKEFEINFDSGLTDDEHHLQFKILRLVVGLSVYLMAKPNALQLGFPKDKGFLLDAPFKEDVTSHSLATRATHASPQEHHRSWFIRQLTHDKYYQGEYATLPPRSRFTFVDETMVNSSSHVQHVNYPPTR
jgi:hypothetical protein